MDERAKLLEKKRKAQEELDKIKEEEERLERLEKESKEDGQRIERREEERKKEDDLAEARRRGLPAAPPRGAGFAPPRGDFDRGPPRRDNWRDDRRPEFDRRDRDRDFDDRRDYRRDPRDPRDRPSMGPRPRVRPLPFLHIDQELIFRHSNHHPTALQTRPHPSLLDFDLQPDEHFLQLAVLGLLLDEHYHQLVVLDPLPDAHFPQLAVLDHLLDVHSRQWVDRDPHLGHKAIPTDPIGTVQVSHHLEELETQGRSLLNQCLMRYVTSYTQWSVLMISKGDRLGNDLLLRE